MLAGLSRHFTLDRVIPTTRRSQSVSSITEDKAWIFIGVLRMLMPGQKMFEAGFKDDHPALRDVVKRKAQQQGISDEGVRELNADADQILEQLKQHVPFSEHDTFNPDGYMDVIDNNIHLLFRLVTILETPIEQISTRPAQGHYGQFVEDFIAFIKQSAEHSSKLNRNNRIEPLCHDSVPSPQGEF